MLEKITRGHRGLQWFTGDCTSVQGITMVYSLQRITRVCKGLQGFTGNHKGLQEVTGR